MDKPLETPVALDGNNPPYAVLTPAPFAAAVYTAKKGDRADLARFVSGLKQANVSVGGLLQEVIPMDAEGETDGMKRVEAVDIMTGKRIPLNQPTKESWRNRECSLDLTALAETTAALRKAVECKVEVMVVEKFGDAEKDGEGLTDDVLKAIADGIPLVIAVPDSNLDVWNELSGGMGDVINCTEDDLHNWWGSIAYRTKELHAIA